MKARSTLGVSVFLAALCTAHADKVTAGTPMEEVVVTAKYPEHLRMEEVIVTAKYPEHPRMEEVVVTAKYPEHLRMEEVVVTAKYPEHLRAEEAAVTAEYAEHLPAAVAAAAEVERSSEAEPIELTGLPEDFFPALPRLAGGERALKF